MADGSVKSIEQCKVGDKVISYLNKRKWVTETVEAVLPQGNCPIFRLATPNHVIKATANHPFMTKTGFKRLDELKVGDRVASLSYIPRLRKTEHSLDDAKMLGFMYGDGWITKHPNQKVPCVMSPVLLKARILLNTMLLKY
jgi:DNA polymerase-3 subunit alpha